MYKFANSEQKLSLEWVFKRIWCSKIIPKLAKERRFQLVW